MIILPEISAIIIEILVGYSRVKCKDKFSIKAVLLPFLWM